MTHPAVRLGLEDRMNALHAALHEEDDLGIVVRAHLYIEHELVGFIRARMSPPEVLDAIELDFDGRVKLAIALGLPTGFCPALHYVDDLRNRFVHRLETTLTKLDVDTFGDALGIYEGIGADAYQTAYPKFSSDTAVPINDWAARDRIILYLLTLGWGIAVADAEAQAG